MFPGTLFRLTLCYGLMLACLGLTACQSPQAPSSAPTSPVSSGEELFMSYCAGCHGGGGNTLVPEKPVKGSPKIGSLAVFQEFLRHPSGNMPAFSAEQIPDAQVAELYQYISQTYP